MGLFPETGPPCGSLTTAEVVGTPKMRRKLFVDILSMVGGGGGGGGSNASSVSSIPSKSSDAPEICTTIMRLTDEPPVYPGTEGFIATSNGAAATIHSKGMTTGRFPSSRSAHQQLSTSWEFLRWVRLLKQNSNTIFDDWKSWKPKFVKIESLWLYLC